VRLLTEALAAPVLSTEFQVTPPSMLCSRVVEVEEADFVQVKFTLVPDVVATRLVGDARGGAGGV
jgi:hypothetical protein